MNGRGRLRLAIGAGGAALLGSLFMPWAGGRNGWELLTTFDVFLLLVATVALAAAVTGGRVGVFRPDVSLNGAADLLSVIASVLVAWFLLADFPDGAGRGAGGYVALAAAAGIAAAAGDYRVLRGAPAFPRL